MAAPPTGAAAGKGSVRAAPARAGDATLAALTGQGRASAAGEAARAPTTATTGQMEQGRENIANRNTNAAGSEAGSAPEGTRTTAPPQGAKQRTGNARTAAPRAGFALALAQSLAVPPAQGLASDAAQAGETPPVESQVDVAQPATEATARQDDKPDTAAAGDAASATVAAMLQWLRPAVASSTGDPQGGSPRGEGQGTDSGVASIGAASAVAANAGVAAAGSDASAATVVPLSPGLPVNAAAAAVASAAAEALAQAGGPAAGAAREPASTGPAKDTPAVAGGGRAPGHAGTAANSQGFDAIAHAIRDATMLDDTATGRGSAGRQGSGEPDQDAGAAVPASAAGEAVGSAAAMANALRTAANAAAPAERTVPVNVHDRHWPQAVAGQVLVLTDQRIDTATLRLSPEHLGPVEVHIDMQAQGVNVSFHADHADTRTALEQALPQLRAAFAGAGLTLGQATVQQQMRHGSQNAPATTQDPAAPADQVGVTPAVIRAIGLVDEYA